MPVEPFEPRARAGMLVRLGSLELRQLDAMSRQELTGTLLKLRDCTMIEFTEEWLNRQGTDRLRMLLLALRLIRVLRLPDACPDG